MKTLQKNEKSNFPKFNFMKPEKCFQTIIIKLTELHNYTFTNHKTDICCQIYKIFVHQNEYSNQAQVLSTLIEYMFLTNWKIRL